MKVGIYHNPGSFSETWINYCQEHQVLYKLIDVYRYDIVDQLRDCDLFMWHFSQSNYKDMLVARPILNAIENMGIRVFPDFNTNWHFDDKLGEQYLLEAIGAPVVPGYMFYTYREAIDWIREASFPKVFKLRGGAGASNVRLVDSRQEACKLAKQAFSKGFKQYDPWGYVKERCRQFREGKINLLAFFKSCGRLIIPKEYAKMHGNEKGYLYFQEFMPDNSYDIRIIICAGRAFGIKRLVRKNDFRASGSGHIIYSKEELDEACVRISFEVNRKIKAQSLALDFVYDAEKHPLIVELSYGYSLAGYKDKCTGFWDEELNWHEGYFDPQEWQIENLINEFK